MNLETESSSVPPDADAPAESGWREAMRQFIGTFSFVKRGMVEFTVPATASLLAQELGWRALVRGRLDMLAAASLDSWFTVELNGVRIVLPRYTLMTMRDCITASVDSGIGLLVETPHWEKMREQFTDGTLFMDVGASTGAMSIPYAVSATGELRIVAFEPSRRARSYLEASVARNKIANVTVLPYALSDAPGSFEFMELPEDNIGDTPYLPEGSRLRTSGERLYPHAAAYDVDVRALDSLAETLRFSEAKNIVVKIDVEGFEDKVLLGARDLLVRQKPFLSIDIHNFPGRATMTDGACAAILAPLGYQIERIGHVMLARRG
jgi:FkbM family methyltransferase